MSSVVVASELRRERLLNDDLDKRVDLLLANLPSHENPDDRYHAVSANPRTMGYLRFLLRHYAKSPTPWRDCFKDNFKRFGPKAKGLCGVLKDSIRQSASWRHGAPTGPHAGHPDAGAPGVAIGEADKWAAPAWGGHHLSEERSLSLLDELDLAFGVVDHEEPIRAAAEVLIALGEQCDVFRVLIGLDEPPVLKLAASAPIAGALIVHARDSGRVLLVKRSHDPKDPDGVRDRWEFAGGHLRPSDGSPFNGAKREWGEETGARLPSNAQRGAEVLSPNGKHRSFVVHVDHEKDIDATKPDPHEVSQAAWRDPQTLSNDSTIRDEVQKALPRIQAAITKTPKLATA